MALALSLMRLPATIDLFKSGMTVAGIYVLPEAIRPAVRLLTKSTTAKGA